MQLQNEKKEVPFNSQVVSIILWKLLKEKKQIAFEHNKRKNYFWSRKV